MSNFVLGMDPGWNTGVATFADGKLFCLQTIQPHEIQGFIQDLIRVSGVRRVIFEDSRLQSHVWTPSRGAAALKIARNIGEIDAWSRLISATCEQVGIPAHGISPKSKGAKLDAKQFASITGWTARSNQHERDSAMVAWSYQTKPQTPAFRHGVKAREINPDEDYPLGPQLTVKASWLKPVPMRYFGGETP